MRWQSWPVKWGLAQGLLWRLVGLLARRSKLLRVSAPVSSEHGGEREQSVQPVLSGGLGAGGVLGRGFLPATPR